MLSSHVTSFSSAKKLFYRRYIGQSKSVDLAVAGLSILIHKIQKATKVTLLNVQYLS